MSGKNTHKRVAIDTMVLIWGVRKGGPEEKRKCAEWLFDQFDDDGVQVVVPAVSIAEYLIPVPPNKRAAVVAEISTMFHIQPLDPIAATIAASLWEVGKKRIKKGAEFDRLILKVDTLVVGCAKSAGVTALYTHDGECRALADHVGIEGRDLPNASGYLWSPKDLRALKSKRDPQKLPPSTPKAKKAKKG